MSPAGPYHLEDLHEAGGVYGIMKELSAKALVDRKCMTVEGRKVGDLLKGVEVLDPMFTRPLSQAIPREGATRRASRNSCSRAPSSRRQACQTGMRRFTGKARIFESEEETVKAIMQGKVKSR